MIAEYIAAPGHQWIVRLGEDGVSEVQRDRINGTRLGLGELNMNELWGEGGLDQLVAAIRSIVCRKDLLEIDSWADLLDEKLARKV